MDGYGGNQGMPKTVWVLHIFGPHDYEESEYDKKEGMFDTVGITVWESEEEAEDHLDAFMIEDWDSEGWGNLPDSRKRMRKVYRKNDAKKWSIVECEVGESLNTPYPIKISM